MNTINYSEQSITIHRAFRWYSLYKTGKCTICGSSLTPYRMAFRGKDKNGHFQLTCQECKKYLPHPISAESAIDAINKRKWRLPNSQSHLWRYMDLARFVFLLSSRKLYFTRLDHFEDKYEGAICSELGFQGFDMHDKCKRRDMAIEMLRKEGIINPSETEIIEKVSELRQEFDRNRERNRKQTFVNCWSENDCESEAMWRLYSKDIKCGVAIHTTYEKLFNSLNPYEPFSIGGVLYVNYDKNFNEPLYSVWYKRKSLEYEKEIRAVLEYPTSDNHAPDKQLPIDLETLIMEVVTSPEAEPWFVNLVKELCEQYNLSCKVRNSEIQTKVYY